MISGNKHSVRLGDEVVVHDVSWEIDPTTDPKSSTDTINDGPHKGKQIRGIYRLDGDTLTSCVGPIDGPRPTKFTATPGSGQTLRVLRRVTDDGAKDEAVKAELKRFEGTWKFVSMVFNGKAVPEESFKDSRMVCEGDRFSTKGNEEEAHGTFRVDPTVKPKTIDIALVDRSGRRSRSWASTRWRAIRTRSAPACPASRGQPIRVQGGHGLAGHDAGETLTGWSRRHRRRKLSGRTNAAAGRDRPVPVGPHDEHFDSAPRTSPRPGDGRRGPHPPGVAVPGHKADYERPTACGNGLAERSSGHRSGPTGRRRRRFWYRNDGPDGTHAFFVVDAAKGTRRPAFDHAKLAEALGRTLGKPQKPSRLPVANIAFRQEGAVDVLVDGKTWRFFEADGSMKPTDPARAGHHAADFNRRRGDGRPSSWSPRG